MREQFISGFDKGIRFADARNNTETDLHIEFLNSFDDERQGYGAAKTMFENGVECIYQAAGGSGIGVINAARDSGKWVIGVDTDQGLEMVQAGNDAAEHILTSTVKRWGTGIYLVCREFLLAGTIPPGSHVVGIPEGAVDIAINPYNTPALLEQLDLIAEMRGDLANGIIPTAAKRDKADVWQPKEVDSGDPQFSLTVNDPALSEKIDESYGPALQKALSTSLHNSGRYFIISPGQKSGLLKEIKASFEATSDEQQLEAGRLVAAQLVAFVDFSLVGSMYRLDIKIVDVETGIAASALSQSFETIEKLFDDLDAVVGELNAR